MRCGRVNPCSGWGQAVPDEAFAIRDSQFNYPQIAVLGPATFQIVLKFLFIFNYLRFGNAPLPGAIDIRHPFIERAKILIINENYQDSSSIAFALLQDHGKAADSLRGADQTIDFEMGGEAGVH